MKVALLVLGGIIALGLVITAVGYLLPVKHVASRERVLPAPPRAIFATIADPAGYVRWRSGLQQVEMLPPVGALPSYRERGKDGTITYVFEEVVPDSRLVSRIADKTLPFGGSWTYELSPRDSGTLVRITEHGEVYNPVFRVVSQLVIGHHRTIDTVLGDLARAVADR